MANKYGRKLPSMKDGFISRRRFIKYSAMTAAALTLFPKQSLKAADRKKPNIIYLLVDQWRASATSYAGDQNVRTPNLDRLAKESLNFRNAVSVCPVSTPYRASLMTGRYPTSTGMFLNDAHLPDSELCIAEVLKEADYQTAYIGKWHLDGHGRSSFIPSERRQGFDYWKAAECDHNYNHSHYYSGNSDEKLYWEGYDAYAQTKDAQEYIRNQGKSSQSFALFVSFGTPHFPLETAPEELKAFYPPERIKLLPNVPEEMKTPAQQAAQGYYAHCEALDKCIGDLLVTIDEAGLRENSILVFTSDHGEMLGSHGVRPKEKQVPWSESAGVPFLLRFPAVYGNNGRTVNMPLTTPDIFPTLLSLAGLKVPDIIEGDDLSSLIKNGKEKKNRAVLYMGVAPFLQGPYAKEYRAIRTNRYTYVRGLEGPWLLYDDVKDPFQMDNLVSKPDNKQLLKKLDKLLESLLNKINDDFRPGSSYISEWGYNPAPHGSVPYQGSGLKPQTPNRKLGKPR